MADPAERKHREAVSKTTSESGIRAILENHYGQVWDTSQLQQDFEVIGFMSPFVVVRRRSDGVQGSLCFQHRPRYYFQFQQAKD